MGAGASVPDEVTFEQAKALAGDKWEDKLTTFWPEVEGNAAEKITKEELLAIIQNIPSFATKHSMEERLNWDEQVVKGADNNAAVDMDAPLPPDATSGPTQKREKVETEKREKLDMEEKRQAALAEANGMTPEELKKMKSANKGPAKPPRAARKPGKQQSSELRALLRQQKKASKMSGRPPSRGMDEMEIQILAKPRGQGPQAAPEVMTFGDDPAEPEPVNPEEQPGMVNCTC